MPRTLGDVPARTGGGYYKPGFATVRFESVEERLRTGNKNTDGILLRAIFVDGPYEGKKVAIFRQLSEKAEYRSTNILFAAGLIPKTTYIPDAGDYTAASWAKAFKQVIGLTAPMQILTEPNPAHVNDPENEPVYRNEYAFKSPPRNGATNGGSNGGANGAAHDAATDDYEEEEFATE